MTSAISIPREPVPLRIAILHGPVPVSGILLHRWNPTGIRAPPLAGPLAVSGNVTLFPTGTDYRVTNSPTPQNEVSVAINPRSQYNLLASANDYRGYPGLPGDGWCGVYTTFDSGRTWIEQVVPRNGPLTQVTVSGDPSVAFDADGNGYVTCLGFSRTAPDNVLAVTKSTDGGRTWGTAVLVEGTTPNVFHDKSYMTVDTTSGPTRNNVYVTWTRFINGPGECGSYAAPIYFSRSIDGGLTFSTPMEISSAGYRCSQGSQPAVGPGGELYVSWVTGTRAVVVRSTDGGLTWGAKTTIPMFPPPEIYGGSPRTPHFPSIAVNPVNGPGGNRVHVVWADRRFGTADILMSTSEDGAATWGAKTTIGMNPPPEIYGGSPRAPHFPSIAVNPVNAPGGNRVHVVWTDRRFGTADILMSTSEDGAATWGAPVRVNDDPTNAQFYPWVAASETGKVFVSFYDQRDDPAGRNLTVYVAVSVDFGVSFQPNRRASVASFDPGNWFIGDYNGLAASGDFAYPGWCDLRNGGNEEVYIAGPPTLSPRLPRMMIP